MSLADPVSLLSSSSLPLSPPPFSFHWTSTLIYVSWTFLLYSATNPLDPSIPHLRDAVRGLLEHVHALSRTTFQFSLLHPFMVSHHVSISFTVLLHALMRFPYDTPSSRHGTSEPGLSFASFRTHLSKTRRRNSLRFSATFKSSSEPPKLFAFLSDFLPRFDLTVSPLPLSFFSLSPQKRHGSSRGSTASRTQAGENVRKFTRRGHLRSTSGLQLPEQV